MHFCWLTRLISVRVTRKIGHNAFPAYFFFNPQSGKIIILKHDVAISIEPAKVVPIGEESRSGSERLHAGAFPLLAWMARTAATCAKNTVACRLEEHTSEIQSLLRNKEAD